MWFSRANNGAHKYTFLLLNRLVKGSIGCRDWPHKYVILLECKRYTVALCYFVTGNQRTLWNYIYTVLLQPVTLIKNAGKREHDFPLSRSLTLQD